MGRATRFRVVAAVLMTGMAGAAAAPARGKAAPPAGPEQAVLERLDRALKSENLENALYQYRSLVHVQGAEDPRRVRELAALSLRWDMRLGKGWIAISAAEALARGGDREAREFLVERLQDPETQSAHRRQVAEFLGEIRLAEAAPALERAAYDRDAAPTVRLAACEALHAVGDTSGVAYLATSLKDPDRLVRLQAARVLGDRRIDAATALWEAVKTEDVQVRFLALRALARLGEERALRLLQADFGDDPPLLIPEERVVPEGAPEGTPERIRYDYRDLSRKTDLGQVLMELGDRRPVRYFREAVHSPLVPMDTGALAAAVLPADAEAGRQLLREVLDGNFSLGSRVSAADHLLSLGEVAGLPEALGAIYREALERADDAVRLRVVQVVARQRLDGSVALLRAALEDPEAVVRIDAARGLGTLGDAAGLPTLRRELQASNRLEAVRAAGALIALPALPPGAKPAGSAGGG